MTFILAYWKYLAGAAVVIAAVAAWSIHGEARFRAGIAYREAIDQKALVEAQKAADAQTAALQAKADKAAKEAANAIQQYNDYVDKYPIGPVRVCHAANPSLPQTSPPTAGIEGTGTQSASVPSVSTGTAGPDISAGLDALMRAAATLASQYREFQQR